ncbi:MAG: acetyl-CoA hydrolase/transferase C-terminal domain-containing protein [Ktedonobacterales bacterium]
MTRTTLNILLLCVVTDYGIALLHGRDLAERASSLIGVAAPPFREQLEREAYRFHLTEKRPASSVPSSSSRILK